MPEGPDHMESILKDSLTILIAKVTTLPIVPLVESEDEIICYLPNEDLHALRFFPIIVNEHAIHIILLCNAIQHIKGAWNALDLSSKKEIV